jgi:uncharacterized protein YndB with AHSA1/START domain
METTMMKTVSVSRRIQVPAEAVWEVVRTGAHLDRWVPAISSCALEGEGVGARRVCVINEQVLRESIETVDDASRLFQYRILEQSMMPVRNVLGTIHVSASGPSETEVLWFVNFELADERAWSAVKEGIESIYSSGIGGLEAHVRAS